MTTKKPDASPSSDTSASTRRDVMKLSMAVAAFGAAMGIAGPGAAATSRGSKTEADRAGRTQTTGKGRSQTNGKSAGRLMEQGKSKSSPIKSTSQKPKDASQNKSN